MPRRSKGPRLWLQKARRDARGKITEYPVWCILDRGRKLSTGFGQGQARDADLALADYIIGKGQAPRESGRDPAQVKVADVISIYADDVVARHARPKETAARLSRILDFFGGQTLAFVNAKSCADYVTARGHQPAARRELEDFRAAVKHHWEAGLCSGLTPVVLPEKSVERERWLTRDEAARLLWAAWRLRQKQFGKATERATAKHVARFILAGLYTGTRAGAICGAAMRPSVGRGHLDIENGVFYRRASGTRQTKKRQPPIRIPPRFLAHCRRWARLGIAHVALVEWNGKPVKRINKAFRAVRAAAGLGADVVPHTLRHTAVTWQAQEGVPAHQICGFFGISFEVFDRVYGHHHPDHQAEAVNALSRPRMKSERLTATERERRGANVVKLRENH